MKRALILIAALAFVFLFSGRADAYTNYNSVYNFSNDVFAEIGLDMESIGGLDPTGCNCPLLDIFCWWKCNVEHVQNYTTTNCFNVSAGFLESFDGAQGIAYYPVECALPPVYQSMGLYALSTQTNQPFLKNFSAPASRPTTIFAQIKYQGHNWTGLNVTGGKQPVLAIVNKTNLSQVYSYSNLTISEDTWQVATTWHTFIKADQYDVVVFFPEFVNMSTDFKLYVDFFRVSTVDANMYLPYYPSDSLAQQFCLSQYGQYQYTSSHSRVMNLCDSCFRETGGYAAFTEPYYGYGGYGGGCWGDPFPVAMDIYNNNTNVTWNARSYWLGADQSTICQVLWFNSSAYEGLNTVIVRMQSEQNYPNTSSMTNLRYCADDGNMIYNWQCQCILPTSDYLFTTQKGWYQIYQNSFGDQGFIETLTNGTRTTYTNTWSHFYGEMQFNNGAHKNIGFGSEYPESGNGMQSDAAGLYRHWYSYGNASNNSTAWRFANISNLNFWITLNDVTTDWLNQTMFFSPATTGIFNTTCNTTAGYTCVNNTEYYIDDECNLWNFSCGTFGCDSNSTRCNTTVGWHCDGNYEYYVTAEYNVINNQSCGTCGCGMDNQCVVGAANWTCHDANEIWHYNSTCDNDIQLLCDIGCNQTLNECINETVCAESIECPNYCNGLTRYYNGACDPYTYNCVYPYSELCGEYCTPSECTAAPFEVNPMFDEPNTMTPTGFMTAIFDGVMGFVNAMGGSYLVIVFIIASAIIILLVLTTLAHIVKKEF